jgi:hypothetical protein
MARKRGASVRLQGPEGPKGLAGLRQAFDQMAFGAERTLNLRAHLPTRAEAVARCEAWLRERQAAGVREVLVVTGRGVGSVDGVSVVREGVLQLLTALSRRSVVKGFQEHTPGSLVVELLPFAEAVAPRRAAGPASPPPADPRTLAGLDPEVRALLRTYAVRELQTLGVHSPTKGLVETHMLARFGELAGRGGAGRDEELRQEIQRALDALDE